jgi:hypothetical protein
MQTITAMRKLLRVRALQHKRLERVVSERQTSLRDAEAQAAQAESEHARCAAVEQSALERRLDLLSGDFLASALEGTNLYLGVCARSTAAAATASGKAQVQVSQHTAALAAAVGLLDRNTEQSEQLEARLDTALKEQAELAEEAESDDAGELAAARISARQRAASAQP